MWETDTRSKSVLLKIYSDVSGAWQDCFFNWSKQQCWGAAVAHSSYSKNCLVPRGDYYGNNHKSYAPVSVSVSPLCGSLQDKTVSSFQTQCLAATGAVDTGLSVIEHFWVGSNNNAEKTMCCWKRHYGGLSLWALLTVSVWRVKGWRAMNSHWSLWWPKKKLEQIEWRWYPRPEEQVVMEILNSRCERICVGRHSWKFLLF